MNRVLAYKTTMENEAAVRKSLISKQLTNGNTAKVYTKTPRKNFCKGHKVDPNLSGIYLSLSISQFTFPFRVILKFFDRVAFTFSSSLDNTKLDRVLDRACECH